MLAFLAAVSCTAAAPVTRHHDMSEVRADSLNVGPMDFAVAGSIVLFIVHLATLGLYAGNFTGPTYLSRNRR